MQSIVAFCSSVAPSGIPCVDHICIDICAVSTEPHTYASHILPLRCKTVQSADERCLKGLRYYHTCLIDVTVFIHEGSLESTLFTSFLSGDRLVVVYQLCADFEGTRDIARSDLGCCGQYLLDLSVVDGRKQAFGCDFPCRFFRLLDCGDCLGSVFCLAAPLRAGSASALSTLSASDAWARLMSTSAFMDIMAFLAGLDAV